MLKNKIIVRKIRNIVILIMAMVIMIGAYKNIDKSRAEDVIEIGAIAVDNYRYLANENFILEAKKIEDDRYEIELPETVNGKKINQIVKITLEDFVPEVENEVVENASTENTEPLENEATGETIPEDVIEEDNTVEIIENKIYLTEEQIDNKEINIEVVYDIAILKQKEDGTYSKTLLAEKTEEERKQLEEAGILKIIVEEQTEQAEKLEKIKILYSKILKYEDEENGKQVKLKGYLPVDAQLQAEELAPEEITKVFGSKQIKVAYDIKIIQKVVTTIPVDEANPESKPEEIIEIIEINPEDFGEKCEVTIIDTKIEEKSKVLHVREDDTLEEVNVTENTEGNVSFEADKFSIYGIETVSESAGEQIETYANTTNTYIPIEYQDSSGNQYVWIEVPKTIYDNASYNNNGNNKPASSTDYSKIEYCLQKYAETYRARNSGTWSGYTFADSNSPDANYNTYKNKMLKSVYENGGFYVGKYETGIGGNGTARTNASQAITQPAVIQANKNVYNYVTITQAAQLTNSLAGNGYTAGLMFGIQWDLILKHLETKNEATVNELKVDSRSWGNYGTGYLLKTGSYAQCEKGGIYDLAGNVEEWTAEVVSQNRTPVGSTVRGGSYTDAGSTVRMAMASIYRGSNESTKDKGFRVMLYANSADTLAPTATSYEVKNVTKDGYDVYVYGVTDNYSGVNRIQFPTWTASNEQDDLDQNWGTSTAYSGTNLGNGTWYYRVNASDHNNEGGYYRTHIYGYDNAGNMSGALFAFDVYVDRTPPTGTLTVSETVTNKSTITVYVNKVSDNYSGVKSVEINAFFGSTYVSHFTSGNVQWDSANSRYYATFEFSQIKNTTTGATNCGDGNTYWFNGQIIDNAGNLYHLPGTSVTYDATRPSATAQLIMKKGSSTGATYSSKSWTNGNVYLGLDTSSAADALSGVKTSYFTYSKNGGTATNATEVTLTEEGKYSITVTTEDKAGNKYTSSTVYEVWIDKTAPVFTNDILTLKYENASGSNYTGHDDGNDGWIGDLTNKNIYVKLNTNVASDSGSGVSELYYNINHSSDGSIAAHEYCCSQMKENLYGQNGENIIEINSGENCLSIINVYCKDLAGNEKEYDYLVSIDKKPPTITVTNTVNGQPYNGGWTKHNVASEIKFNDDKVVMLDLQWGNTINTGTLAWKADDVDNSKDTDWATMGNTSTTTFTDTWSSERESTGYYRISDKAGNTSQVSFPIKIDKTGPTWSYVSKDIYYSASNDVGTDNYANAARTIVINFKGTDNKNKVKSTLTASDITVTVNGNSVSNKNVSLSTTSFANEVTGTLTIENVTGDGTLNVVLGAGTLQDEAGNTNVAKTLTTDISITIDNTNPNINMAIRSPAAGRYKAGNKVTITATYNEDVYKEITSKTKITTTANVPVMKVKFADSGTGKGGNATCTAVNGRVFTYEYTITAGDNGRLSIESLGTVYDIAGNSITGNNVLPSVDVTADTIAPTVTSITPNVSSPTNASSITYTVTFSEEVRNFAASDVTANSGKVNENTEITVSGSGTTWTVVVPTKDNQEYNESITVKANGSVEDLAGNKVSTAKSSSAIVVDRIKPTVSSITANVTSPTNASSITYTVTFSENVTGFKANDVTVNSTKGSVTSVSGSGTTWYVVISTADNQEYNETITVKANGNAIDKAGNKVSTAKTSDTIVVDRIKPTVSSITANVSSPTNASSITYTVTFSENVTGFKATDVTVNSGKGSVTSVSGSGTTWYVVVSTTANAEYTETITVKANGSTKDKAGNKVSTAKTSDTPIVVDRINPYITSLTASPSASPTNASSVTYTMTFSENVTGFATGDVTVVRKVAEISTGLSSLTLAGSAAVPVYTSNTIALSTSKKYMVSFDYKCASGTNQFDVDLWPDDLPQYCPTATTTTQHMDIIFTSSSSNMGSCSLRFFDDIQEASESDITITNIKMYEVVDVTKGTFSGSGSTYTLAVPSVTGYQTIVIPAGVCVDKAGNASVVETDEGAVNATPADALNQTIDVTNPTITVNPTSTTSSYNNYVKTQSVTVTVADQTQNLVNTGLATSNTYSWFLSTNTAPSAASTATNTYGTYTSGSAVTIGAGLTGDYYLFVRQVSDKAGNVSATGGTVVTVGGVKYHRYGVYRFDNKQPTLTGMTLSSYNTNTGRITATANGVTDAHSGVNRLMWYLTKNGQSGYIWSGQASTTQWTKDIDVSSYGEGTYKVGIVMYDNVENMNDTTDVRPGISDSSIGWIEFKYDTTPPKATSSIEVEKDGLVSYFDADNNKGDGHDNSTTQWTNLVGGAALPGGYQKLSYIESTGTQYINTGVNLDTSNIQIQGKYSYTKMMGHSTILGAQGDRGDFLLREESGNLKMWASTGISSSITTVSTGQMIDFNIALSGTSYTYSAGINSGTPVTGSGTRANQNSGSPIYIFDSYYDVTGGLGSHAASTITCKAKLYEMKITKNGTLVRNFIPCKNTSGAVGLYDTVEGKFYGNSGTGSFIAGLPEGYQQLEYIKSTGTQWINSGVAVGANTWVDTDLMFDSAFDYNMMFGSWTSSFAVSLRGVNVVCAGVGGTSSQNIGSTTTTGVKYNIVLGPGKGYVQNGVTTALGGSTNSVSGNTILLFGASAFAEDVPYQWNSYGVGKIYSFKIYNGTTGNTGSSTLLRNFIPCKNSSGTIGLYDSVNGVFYTNQGSGTFTAGPAVASEGSSGSSSYGDATINGATWNDEYLSLDGTDDWVNLGQMSFTNKATLEATVELKSIQSGEVIVLANYDAGGLGLGLRTGIPEFQVYVAGIGYTAASMGTALSTNTKYHLAGTFDGTNIKFYLNGELKKTVTAAGNVQTPTGSTVMAIGTNPTGNNSGGGYSNINVYDARIYNKALTAEQIQQNYDATRIEKEWSDATNGVVVNANKKWAQKHTVTAKLTDNLSGFEAGKTYRYGWSTSSKTAPTTWKSVTPSITAGATTVTFDASNAGEITGKYFLWLSTSDNSTLKDRATNETVMPVSALTRTYFDNTLPVITYDKESSNNTWAGSYSVAVTISDAHSGLASDGKVKYGWARVQNDGSVAAPTEYVTVNLTNADGINSFGFTASTTLPSGYVLPEGRYELWVVPEGQTLKDMANNVVTTTKESTGTFWIDRTAPTITVEAKNEVWKKVQTATVTLADSGSGLTKGEVVKYGWSKSTTEAPVNYTTATVGNYVTNALGTVTSGSFTATTDGLITKKEDTGKYYLWVVPLTYKDVAQNSQTGTMKSSGTFWVDRTPPEITTNYSPVEDGLIHHFDADINTGSTHSGTTTTWTDLGGLPAGYQALTYIESTGTQYIDTGFIPNQNTRIVLDYQHTGDFSALFGARKATTNSVFGMWIDSGVANPHYGNSIYTDAPALSITTTNRLTYDYNKNVVTAGGASSTSATATFNSGYNLTLLAMNEAGTIDARRSKGRIYGCQIYDNGTLVRNFIPCKNPSGTVGLYDTVYDTFYGSALGTFTAGAVKTAAVNGATWSDDYLSFDGSNDFVNIGQISFTNQYTLEATVEIPSVQSGFRSILSNQESGGTALALVDGKITAQPYTTGAGGYVTLTADSAISTNTKHHLVTTYDGTNIKLYVDGTLVKSTTSSGNIKDPASSTIMAIGGGPSGSTANGEFFNGKIYNARIYTKALTATEVTKNYNASINSKTWAKSHNVTVTLSDEHRGLATGANIKYGWSTSPTTVPSSYTTASISSYSADAKTVTFTANKPENSLTGRYFLWVVPTTLIDNAGSGGNAKTTSVITQTRVYFDNTAPTLPTYVAYHTSNNSIYQSGEWTNSKVHTDISSTDEHSGIAKIQYKVTKDNGATWNDWTDLSFGISGGLNKTGTYTWTGTENWTLTQRDDKFYFKVIDKVGNESTVTLDTNNPMWHIRYDLTDPYWEQQNFDVDEANKKVTVNLVGKDAHSGYKSNTLKPEDVKVYIGDTLLPNVVKQIDTTATNGTLKLTLTNFEEATRQLGKRYEILEYIQSSGTQYIDTGYVAPDGFITSAEIAYTQNPGIAYIVGSHNTSAPWGRNGLGTDSNNWEVGIGDAYKTVTSNLVLNTKYTIDGSTVKGDSYMNVNGERVLTSSNISSRSSNNVLIFYNQYYKDVGLNPLQGAKLYSLKIYSKDKTLVRDFIPCKDTSTGAVGLYDTVEEKFYANAGSGSFTAGSVVGELYNSEESPTQDAKSFKEWSGNLSIKVDSLTLEDRAAEQVKNGYIKLPYIESTGTQYIDTGFIPNQDTRIDTKFSATSIANNGIYVYGSGVDSSNTAFELYPWNETLEFNYGTNGGIFVGPIVANQIITTSQNKNSSTFTVNGNTYSATHSEQSFTTPYTLTLFALHRASIITPDSGMKLYSSQIYDNGTLVRDFIPCMNSNGEIGLYDYVNGVFYGNAGTGEFKTDSASAYRELEYIEATGTQYIKTGVTGTARWELDIQFTNTTKRQLMGYGGSSAEYWGVQTSGNYGLSTSWSHMSVKAGGRDTVIHNYGENGQYYLSVQGEKTSMGAADVSAKEYKLISMDTTNYPTWAKLYGVECIQNGTLIREFVPSKNGAGTIGLYDKVNKVFYTNAGTGTFVAGTTTGIVTDKEVYGNKNNANALTLGHADVIEPEFTYKYSETSTIVGHGNGTTNGDQIVKITFDVVDKYFNSTSLTADDITIKIVDENKTIPASAITKTLTKLNDIKETVNGVANTKIGERYQLTITGLDEGTGFDYSGPMSLTFPTGKVSDTSGNTNDATTITIGIDETGSGTGEGSQVIVDVVKPVWKAENVSATTDPTTGKTSAHVDLIGSDKYFQSCSINSVEDIRVMIGTDDVTSQLDVSLTGPEATAESVKYVFTLTDFEENYDEFIAERTKYFANSSTGRLYREFSGPVDVVIPAGTVVDLAGNVSDELTVPLGDIDTLKPEVVKVGSATVDKGAGTATIVFDITDKYMESSVINGTALNTDGTIDNLANADTSKIHVLVDGTERTQITKTITNIEVLKATINGNDDHIVGYRYTVQLGNFKETETSAGYGDYSNWSGNIALKIDAGAAADKYGTTNDAKTLEADLVDVIKPDVTYIYSASDISTSNKTFKMVFEITDKYFSNSTLTKDDLIIKLVDESNEVITGELTKQLDVENITYGKRYTLTLSGFDKLAIKDGEKYVDYSGIISVTIPAGKATDTNGNSNNAKTITSGINVEGDVDLGTEGEIVDVVSPLIEKVSATASAIDPANKASSTATITVKVTDKYALTNNLSGKIKVLAHANGATAGTYTDITSSVAITFGTASTIDYGIQQDITIKGFAQDINQLKIEIQPGAITDDHGNTNITTTLLVYNVLKSAASEDAATSGFLGGTPARQDIERIIFTNSLSGATGTIWDVSAAQDGSIKAWTSQNSAPYTVYIGSNDEMYANSDSQRLFNYIGYSTSCTAPTSGSKPGEIISNLHLLNTTGATSMYQMFNYCGYNAMTKLDLGDNFDTSNVKNMNEMFAYTGYKAMTTLDLGTKFDSSSATSMMSMFSRCGYTAMTKLDLRNSVSEAGTTVAIKFDTKNVGNMSAMFSSCGYTVMTTIDLGTLFDTSNVTNMSYMFNACGYSAMTSLDLSSGTNETNTTQFNTSSVTNMSYMFHECAYITPTTVTFNLGNNFNTSNVTTMDYMFRRLGTTSLVNLDLGDKFDTSKVTNMAYMFNACGNSAMISFDIGDMFDTSKVTNMDTMFGWFGKNLSSLDLGDLFYTTSVTNMNRMFQSCGSSNMTSLDLGPTFTQIASTNTDIFTSTGKSGECVIHAGESIYSSENAFKLNTDSNTTIAYTVGTINPRYRTEWIKETTAVTVDASNSANSKIEVTLRGRTLPTDGTYEYTSNVTSLLPVGTLTGTNVNLVKVYIDGTELTAVTKAVGTATTTANTSTGAQDVLQTITLTEFEEAYRQSGKSFKEWSGNITVELARCTLKDMYGSYVDASSNVVKNVAGNGNLVSNIADTTPSTSNGTGNMFVDTVKPEFTYIAANTTIGNGYNGGTQIVTVIFDITDKYYDSSTIIANKGNIVIKVLDEDTTIDQSKISTELRLTGKLVIDEATGTVTNKATDYTLATGERLVGERYEYVIIGLDQGQGFAYSGPMSITFPSAVAKDKSNNTNNAKTITIGINETGSETEEGSQVIVDVVNPIWKTEGSPTITTVGGVTSATVNLLATDKYLVDSILTKEQIEIYIDGVNRADELNTTLDGPNDTTSTGEKYQLTLPNLEEEYDKFIEEREKYFDDPTTGRLYREFSGPVEIVFPAGELDAEGNLIKGIIDNSGNLNNQLTVDLGTIDTLKPEVVKVSSRNLAGGKQEIIFDITDKYMASSAITLTDTSKIHVFVDGDSADHITKIITDIEPLTAEINSVEETIGYRYTLELSGFDYAMNATGYKDYSGTVSIKIDADTAKDDAGLGNADTTLTGSFIDIVAPVIEKVSSTKDTTAKTETIVFKVTDKYLDTSNFITNGEDETPDEITIYVDGEEVTGLVENLTVAPLTATFNKTVEGAVVNGVYTYGHIYTLVLSKFEEADVSGNVSIEIPEDAVNDTSNNGNEEVPSESMPGDFVDFVKPKIELVSSSKDTSAKTATIVFTATDKYMDLTTAVEQNEITVYVDNELTGLTAVIKSKTEVTARVAGTDKTIGHTYTVEISGFEQPRNALKDYQDWSGTVSIKVKDGAVEDTSDNKNIETTVNGKFVDYVAPDLRYLHETTDIDPAGKSYTMTFSITDKYYDADNSTPFTIDDIRNGNIKLMIDNGQLDGENGEPIIIDLTDEPVTLGLRVEPYKITTGINYTIDTTNGRVASGVGTVVDPLVIGHTYILTISDLENLENKYGIGQTASYSGIVTVGIPKDRIVDTSGNKNVAKTITSGVDIPGGLPDDVVPVDVVIPIWERIASTSLAIDPENPTSSTASITFRGSDTYFKESTLSIDDIQVLVNGEIVTDGITKTVVLTEDEEQYEELWEDRLEYIEGSEERLETSRQYGVEYTITIKGFAQDANQVVIRIPANTLKDETIIGEDEDGNDIVHNNYSVQTDLVLFNVLKKAYIEADSKYEDLPTSPFLGSTIKREKIESVTILPELSKYIMDTWVAAIGTDSSYWDVSEAGNKTIIAHYTDTDANGAYEVQIASRYEIFANQDSSYLFSYIGYGEDCDTATPVINLNSLNTSGVNNMSYMFNHFGYRKMVTFDLDTFNTAYVTNMSNMFNNCGNLAMTTLDLGDNFKTSNVTDMTNMFNGAGQKLMTSFTIGSHFNTAKVKLMSGMFQNFGQEKIQVLSLGNSFYTNEVLDMSNMFNGAGQEELITFSLGSNFNTDKVTNMSGMFQNFAHKLETLTLGSGFKTSAVTNMSNMFNGAGQDGLTTFNIGNNFNTSAVTDMSGMFQDFGTTGLVTLDLGDVFYTTLVTNMDNMFNGCGTSAMTSLDLGPAFTKIPTQHTDFMKNCGTSTLVIYAPEAIYADRTTFK